MPNDDRDYQLPKGAKFDPMTGEPLQPREPEQLSLFDPDTFEPTREDRPETRVEEQTTQLPRQACETSAGQWQKQAPATPPLPQIPTSDERPVPPQGAEHTQRQPKPTATYWRYNEPGMPDERVWPEDATPRNDKTPRQSRRRHMPTGVVGVLAGALGGMAASLVVMGLAMGPIAQTNVTKNNANTTTSTSTTTPSKPLDTANGETTDEAVAKKCLPSVVSVSISEGNASGIGSGVVLDKKGNVITNWHVAGEADIISVTIDGKSYPATLVGGDESSDIAVINVDAPEDVLVPIEVGDSSQLVVGDWVMTLGSPLGLDQSASSGIVSALYRNTSMPTNTGTTLYTNLIQVDAAINGGNSGGALVNEQGQLVGINTLYANGAGTESFAGIGFAIPGNYAVEIANKVIAGEKITHAHIGASCATVNAENARANHLNVARGAYVAEITKESPAEKAGLKVGDVITQIDDATIESADDYILAIRSHQPGDEVKVTVMRGEEKVELNATLDSDEELQKMQEEERKQREELQQRQMNDITTQMNDWPWQMFERMQQL